MLSASRAILLRDDTAESKNDLGLCADKLKWGRCTGTKGGSVMHDEDPRGESKYRLKCFPLPMWPRRRELLATLRNKGWSVRERFHEWFSVLDLSQEEFAFLISSALFSIYLFSGIRVHRAKTRHLSLRLLIWCVLLISIM